MCINYACLLNCFFDRFIDPEYFGENGKPTSAKIKKGAKMKPIYSESFAGNDDGNNSYQYSNILDEYTCIYVIRQQFNNI